MARVAFIGLGNMGGPMAANLVKSGHAVFGYDVAQEVCTTAAGKGIHIADTVEAAIGDADVIMTMLPNGDLVRSVWARAVPAARKGALIIDSSTIDVNSARGAHDCARAAGLLSLDAPVSGGTEGAVAGTLTFMVGGDEASFEAGRSLLAQMGRRIVHCGAAGNGQAAKICNNMILGVTMIAVSEAFNLAEQVGLSHQALFDVASSSSGQCYALTTHCPVPGPVPTASSNRGYTPGFASELMLKDLRLSQEVAEASRAATPLGAAARDIFDRFVENGGRGRDYSAVIQFLRG
ncbi:3-hydroxyisobutyrate dehydrogenase [Methylobacterium soli]|uniref:3-hydroxyisobutyrate dehydrogenase n=1 Tax=Methylobacterium soli TaxID=553447 RepID=A0A6L3T3N1_9HYPH|nr:3-hydroxyisobutyrate dehydrogenase [Methylobacterium soli]KAB1080834.1 3-hydroxyisobutyrate dehydrogenase [Methylobacterium soli]GJE44385.1 putative 3-hydroxyisobutyrate dehydrogenase [Methylobacterium soli]